MKEISLEKHVIMGVLNVAPDSFYDGGRYQSSGAWNSQTEKMLQDGADIIDIGAVSTRPGSREVTEDEEKKRLEKPLTQLTREFPETVFSVDTYRASVADFAINSGAGMINDISGGTFDEKMFEVICKQNVAYVLMHTSGSPETMQENPDYKNVTDELKDFFFERLNYLKGMGKSENIILDPGFGFGKTLSNNYELLNAIRKFKELGFPVLVGLSRKSMINKVLGTKPEEALNGTSVLNTIALLNGADILRVHDVKEAREVINLVSTYLISNA